MSRANWAATERTIKAHRQVIMEKMKVQSLVQLVTMPSGSVF
jgi:FixJ family two-component response regulator